MGLELINILKVQKLLILDESLLVLNQARKNIIKEETSINKFQKRIVENLKQIKEANLLHVRRCNNIIVDELALKL